MANGPCSDCKWYKPLEIPVGQYTGECHKEHPSVVVTSSGRVRGACYPLVKESWWCDDFKPG